MQHIASSKSEIATSAVSIGLSDSAESSPLAQNDSQGGERFEKLLLEQSQGKEKVSYTQSNPQAAQIIVKEPENIDKNNIPSEEEVLQPETKATDLKVTDEHAQLESEQQGVLLKDKVSVDVNVKIIESQQFIDNVNQQEEVGLIEKGIYVAEENGETRLSEDKHNKLIIEGTVDNQEGLVDWLTLIEGGKSIELSGVSRNEINLAVDLKLVKNENLSHNLNEQELDAAIPNESLLKLLAQLKESETNELSIEQAVADFDVSVDLALPLEENLETVVESFAPVIQAISNELSFEQESHVNSIQNVQTQLASIIREEQLGSSTDIESLDNALVIQLVSTQFSDSSKTGTPQESEAIIEQSLLNSERRLAL